MNHDRSPPLLRPIEALGIRGGQPSRNAAADRLVCTPHSSRVAAISIGDDFHVAADHDCCRRDCVAGSDIDLFGKFDRAIHVGLEVDGQSRRRASGTDGLSNPLTPLVRLVEVFRRWGEGLRARVMISTGSRTGMLPMSACQRVPLSSIRSMSPNFNSARAIAFMRCRCAVMAGEANGDDYRIDDKTLTASLTDNEAARSFFGRPLRAMSFEGLASLQSVKPRE